MSTHMFSWRNKNNVNSFWLKNAPYPQLILVSIQDPHVESYEMSDIENELGIDRDGLVALALLLGCDYVPKGVPGIGYANAIKLMETLRGRNVLKR